MQALFFRNSMLCTAFRFGAAKLQQGVLHLVIHLLAKTCPPQEKCRISHILVLVTDADKCTVYTIQFSSESEYERFYNKFVNDAQLNQDLLRIVALIDKISEHGALERYFRREDSMRDSVVALPALKSRLRLYCLRLTDQILVLGNGGAKKFAPIRRTTHCGAMS